MGISLVAFTGLFGGYLGNGRTPRAYAVGSAPTCATSTTLHISSEADWSANVGAAWNPGVECVIWSIDADFTVNQTFGFVYPGGTDPVTVIIDGNDHTITGAANTNNKTFIGAGLRPIDELYISDLTLSGMRNTGWPGSAIDAYTRGSGAASVTLDHVTVEDGHNEGLAFFRPQVYIRGKATIVDSTFTNNSNTALARNSSHDGPGAAVMLYGPIDGSLISHSTFTDNTITANLGVAPAPAGQSYGAALAILNNWANTANTVTIEDSVFSGNSVLSSDGVNRGVAIGGAISSGASLIVHNSVFTDNSASGGQLASGGAIEMGQGWSSGYEKPDLTIVDSEFSGNSATTLTGNAVGGAIGGRQLMGDLTIESSTFADNTATSASGKALGGAIGVVADSSAMAFHLLNSTVTGNTASGTTDVRGGGLYAATAPLTVDFSTITLNTATTGGGIFSVADDTVTNSIANGNSGTTGADVYSSGRTTSDHSLFTAQGSVAGSFSSGTATIFDAAAQVGSLADNGGTVLPTGSTIRTMAITSTSTAIDAGIAGLPGQPADDERGSGFPRVVGTAPDLGAVEVFGRPAAPTQVQATPRNGSASIAFTPGDAGSSAITNYEYQLDGGNWMAFSPALTGSPVRITGLSNGQTYSVSLRAVNAVGAGLPSAPVSVTPAAPPPTYPPSAPLDVTADAGDGQAQVTWRQPASSGSFPVTDYLVTAAPGGRSCLAKAPELTCTVTGLTNGTSYTFVVKALNAAGWSATSDPSVPVTPFASMSVTLDPGARTKEGNQDRITTTGTAVGIPEGAQLTPYISYGDGDFVAGDASITVDAQGRFTWSRLVTSGKKLTAYVAYQDAVSNRVVWQALSPRSLTLFPGRRQAAGMHDRITTGGTSVGVPAGARLTPWIRYGKNGAFSQGQATIVVGSKGRFTWTREIRKDKTFTAYVAYEDLASNRVVWKRVR